VKKHGKIKQGGSDGNKNMKAAKTACASSARKWRRKNRNMRQSISIIGIEKAASSGEYQHQ